MNNTTAQNNKSQELEAVNDLIIDSIQDIKGKDIIKLDLRNLDDAPTDFFIICSGESNTQLRAIAQNVHKRLKEEAGMMSFKKSGTQSDTWILVDYFHTVVHIFHPEAREFYELEDLWSDADFTEYQNI